MISLLRLTKLYGTVALTLLFLTGCARCKGCVDYPSQHWPRYADWTIAAGPTPPRTGTLKAVSYNIYHGQKTHQAIELLRTHPDLRDADFILLQEQDWSGVKTIARALDMNYVYYPSAVHHKFRQDFGNAVLSRWPLYSDRKIILEGSETSKTQRIAVGVLADVKGAVIQLFSVHMDVLTSSSERERQIAKIIAHADAQADAVIVGGDFNTFTRKNLRTVAETFYAHEFQFATAHVGYTYELSWLLFKKLHLDQIYTHGVSVSEAGKVHDFEASDHLPIWTDFTLTETP